jgi:hypothetical protein
MGVGCRRVVAGGRCSRYVLSILPDVMVPETSEPAGAEGDAALGEGDTRVVVEGDRLRGIEDEAGLCWGTDEVWLAHPTATSAIAPTVVANRHGVRIVVFRSPHPDGMGT